MIPTALRLLLAAALAAPAVAAEPIRGFDPAAMDLSAKPCADFYQYACGGWLKANPVPADQSRWGRFNELAERNKEILREALEAAAAEPRAAHERRAGTLYSACMDENAVEEAGTKPLAQAMAAIDRLEGPRALAELLARLHRAGIGAGFAHGSEQDYKDSSRVIAALDQSGLGLPDRDYYLKDDAKSLELRKAYEWHVARTFGLNGDAPGAAAARAAAVMRVETALAKASMDRVLRRDPANTYHLIARKDLPKAAPGFDWEAYFAAAGGPAWTTANDNSPEFTKAWAAFAASGSRDDLKDYLRWRVLSGSSAWLGRAFVEENFDFFGRRLTGAKQLKPRWKRCVELTDGLLGHDLGRLYVAKAYPPDAKAKMDELVKALEDALRRDIESLPWMTPATKAKALAKLGTMGNKVGYPRKWRDYSSVRLDRKDLLGSVRAAREFEYKRELSKIGKPVDRHEWHMTPPTVNAYYNPQMNDINFPAGILQPPFFDREMDDAVNLGGIGAVIGHELTHGFDDSGRKFDARGNMEDWWTSEDGKAFEEKAACFDRQYAGYEVLPGVKLNGKLTLGENTADNGGLRVAYLALEKLVAAGKAAPRDGFAPKQRIFLGWAQIWCQNRTEAVARMLAQVDSHSAAEWRVRGPLMNMPEFAEAFSCEAGDRMAAKNACRVW